MIELYDFLKAISYGKEFLEIKYVGSGSYGFVFKFILKNNELNKKKIFCIKFSTFSIFDNSACDPRDNSKPENVEHQMLDIINNISFREKIN